MSHLNNLPSWPGASEVYSRAYDVLEQMGADDWKAHRSSRLTRKLPFSPSMEMRDLTEALGEGDEERIKGLMLLAHNRGYHPRKKESS